MIIGNFSYDPDRDIYTGGIMTLTVERSNVQFRPIDKNGEKEPDYRVMQDRDGALVEFGAAWKRSSGRGRDFLSVLLDDPALPSSLNAALFLSAEDQRATLVWQRQNKAATTTKAEPPAANGRKRTARPRGPQPG